MAFFQSNLTFRGKVSKISMTMCLGYAFKFRPRHDAGAQFALSSLASYNRHAIGEVIHKGLGRHGHGWRHARRHTDHVPYVDTEDLRASNLMCVPLPMLRICPADLCGGVVSE